MDQIGDTNAKNVGIFKNALKVLRKLLVEWYLYEVLTNNLDYQKIHL